VDNEPVSEHDQVHHQLYQLRFKALADVGEDIFHKIEQGLAEDISTVFGDKDQMYVHVEDTMSSCSNIS